MTQDNASDFPALLQLMDDNDIDKFYLSHLNYGGRGNRNHKDDAHFDMTRNAMDLMFKTCYDGLKAGKDYEFVTGNNDADAVYFLHWVTRHFPDKAEHIKAKLEQWGVMLQESMSPIPTTWTMFILIHSGGIMIGAMSRSARSPRYGKTL